MELNNNTTTIKNNVVDETHEPKDVFDLLPFEILDQVLGRLEHASLFNCMTLSTRWSDRVVPHLWASPWMMYYISWTKMIRSLAKSAEDAQKHTMDMIAAVAVDMEEESGRVSREAGLSEDETGPCLIPSPQVQRQNDGHGSIAGASVLQVPTPQRWCCRVESDGGGEEFTRGDEDNLIEDEGDDRSDSEAHVDLDRMWKEEDTRRPLLPKASRTSSLLSFSSDAATLSSRRPTATNSMTSLRAPRSAKTYGEYIRTLDFSQLYYVISDQFLSHLIPLAPNLSSLTIHSPKQLSDVSLILLAASCPLLSVLDLAGCTKITDKGINALLEKCANMSSLNLANGTRALSDKTLEGIAKRWGKTLKSLNLANTSTGSPSSLATTTPTTTVRDEGSLGSFSVLDPGLLTIAIHCRSLQSLNISHCILRNASSPSSPSLSPSSPSSSPLSLFSSSFSSTSSSNGFPKDGDLPAEGGTLEFFLSQLPPSLQILNLRSCFDLSDKGLISLARACPDLRELDVTACSLVTDRGIRAIGEGCRQFETLIMDDRYGRVTDQLLKSFPPWGEQLLQRRAMLGSKYSRIF